MKRADSVSYVSYFGSTFKTPDWARDTAAFLEHGVKRGWRVTIVLSHRPAEKGWLEPLLSAGVDIECVPRAAGNFDLTCVRRVRRLCQTVRCDVFHCDNIHTSPLIGAAVAGVPVRLWSKRSMEPSFEDGRRANLRDRLALSVRLSCWLATRTVAVSSAVKEELCNLGVPEPKVVVFPHYARRVVAPDRDEARRLFGVGESEIVITTVGHAVRVKGWDILLAAFAELLHDRPQIRLLLVGDYTDDSQRPFYQHLRGMVDGHGMAGRVTFTGHLLNVGLALAATDIFVQSSRAEGFSFALVEAMTSGLPCVSTRVGVAPEVIEDGANGLLVERGSVGELAKAVGRLIDDHDLQVRIGGAARNVTLPSLDQEAEKMFLLYEELLKIQTDRVLR
jgi:glycosyltransferase involved in cell wall biosynthesis